MIAVLGRVFLPDDTLGSALKLPIVAISPDPRLAAIIEMERSWPGHFDWVIAYSVQARALFEANDNRSCPRTVVVGGMTRCLLDMPLVTAK